MFWAFLFNFVSPIKSLDQMLNIVDESLALGKVVEGHDLPAMWAF